MRWYSNERRIGKYVKGYGFLKISKIYKKILDAKGLHASKSASKKVI